MPKIFTMSEFTALSTEAMDKLLPVDFVPEVYCRQFGNVEYQRFYHMVSVANSALVKLTDGSRLRYYESHMEYIPLGKFNLN